MPVRRRHGVVLTEQAEGRRPARRRLVGWRVGVLAHVREAGGGRCREREVGGGRCRRIRQDARRRRLVLTAAGRPAPAAEKTTAADATSGIELTIKKKEEEEDPGLLRRVISWIGSWFGL